MGKATLIVHPYYKEADDEFPFVNWQAINEKLDDPQLSLHDKLKSLSEYIYNVTTLCKLFESTLKHGDMDYFWVAKNYDPVMIKVVDDKMVVRSHTYATIDKEYDYSVNGLKQLLDDFNKTVITYLAFLIGDILHYKQLQDAFWKTHEMQEEWYERMVYESNK